MNKKKIVVISNILNGRTKISLNYNISDNIIGTENNQLLVNIYNYASSIMSEKHFFDNYILIDNLFQQKIGNYTFVQLFKSFRNKNEHPNKKEENDLYVYFKTNITLKMVRELLNVCDEVVINELNKMTKDELAKIFFNNIEIISLFNYLMNRAVEANEKEQNNKLADVNNRMLELFTNSRIEDLTLEKLEAIYFELLGYFNNENVKKFIINYYNRYVYDEIVSILSDVDADMNISRERMKNIVNLMKQLESIKK